MHQSTLMKQVALLIRAIILTSGLIVISPVLAESAPVYDADSLPPQFDDGYRQNQQELPPPPAPGDEQAFVPMPSTAPAQNIVPVTSQSSSSADQRLRTVEQQLNRMQGSVSTQRIESLQTEVQTLRGQVEQLSHQLQQLQQQQKSQYQDLDKRLSEQPPKSMDRPAVNVVKGKGPEEKLEDNDVVADEDTSPVSLSPTKPVRKPIVTKPKTSKADVQVATDVNSASSATNDQPNVDEEQQVYQTAFNLIKSKKYNEAIQAMQGMLNKYPTGQFAANAHYWLGMLYDLTKKPEQALQEFSAVVKSYPNSPRVADAQLKVGLIYASQFKWVEAKTAFKKVVSRNPGSSSARIAVEQLKQMKQAGH